MRFKFFGTILVLLSTVLASGSVWASVDEDDAMDAFAKQLLQTLEKNTSYIERAKSLSGYEQLSLAVWPFRSEDIPVPSGVVERWNKMLVASLVRQKPSYFRVVTRSDLKAIILEASNMGGFDGVENPVAALAKKARVNFLIVGEARSEYGGINLSYQAVRVNTGEVMAVTQSKFMEVDVAKASERQNIKTLDAAIFEAAKKLAGSSIALETMEVYGVREGGSKAVTDFSAYVTDRLTSAITDATAQAFPDHHLKIKDALFLKPAVRSAKMDREKNMTFRLGGVFWNMGEFIDLLVALQNGAGDRVTWRGKIDTRSVDQSLLSGRSGGPEVAKRDLGPLGLKITSSKGRNPLYKVGDTMTLWIKLQRDAYLNCYYRQANGEALKIYPNRYLDVRIQSGFTRKGDVVVIPGAGMPFKFEVTPPEGREQVICFATDKDVTAALPPELRKDLEPIDKGVFKNIRKHFRSQKGRKISESSMTVTVRGGGI